jgi:LAS superfamily LD-carboxypeptidase LdcB
VREIEQRFAALGSAQATSRPGQPLGFGMMLEQASAAGAAVSVDSLASPAMSNRMLTPAVQKSPGSYGPLAPPPELVVFGNGAVPADALAPVGDTNHRLWAPAANGLTALMDDAAAAGIDIGITDSYRPLAVQERLALEKGLYNEGGLAAVPGTSNHGWGVATDLDLDRPGLEWMRKNGWRYGFVEDVPREPWHWTYRPAN